MITKFATVTLRTALVAAATLIASESIVLAQAEPPSGQRGGQNGGRGGQNGGRGGQNGGGQNGGGFGRMFGGQNGGGNMRGGMGGLRDLREALEADFMRRDVPIFVRQLSLTEDQSGVLETLFVDYEATFQPESEAIQASMMDIGRNMMQSVMSPERREQMQQMRERMQDEMRQLEEANGPMDDDARRAFFRERMQKAVEEFAQQSQASGLDAELKGAIGELLEKLEQWQSRKAQLRTNFTEGLKVVLDDDQLALWPAFERFLNREKTLPRGRISGESLNLFFVVDEMRMPPEDFARIEPLFDDYETRLDNALKARNAYLEESMPRIMKAVQSQDSGDAERIFRRQADLRAAVRDVNDEFRKAMVNALGDTEWARALDKQVLETGWDRFFRPTNTDRMFEEAMKLEDLDPAVLQSVRDLYASYRTELSPMNNRLKDLARTEEPSQIVRDGERMVTMMSQGIAGMARGFGPGGGNDAGEDPMRKVFDERNDLGERYEERLKALLTPEQFEKLPRGRGGRGGRGGAGGAGGNFDPNAFLDRMPEEQRKQFMEAVDKNKNGTIDEDERDGIRDYMRQQFGNMRGGQGGGAAGGAQGGQGGGRRGNRGGGNEV
ncbi:MAG: hypothetical protein RL136_457 [Planctomycetota bacterium]|jgi:hypothetical protein